MKFSSQLKLAFVAVVSTVPAKAIFAGAGHKAHVHGTAELDIALEAQELTIIFESPSDSIYGFEHEAKTEKDIKARDAAVEIFKTNVATLFSLPESLGCVHSITKLEAFKADDDDHLDDDDKANEKANEKANTKANAKSKKQHAHKGTHGEFEVEVKVTCKSPLKEQTMDIGLFNKFSRLSKIKVQIVGEKSSSTQLTKKSTKIKF
jgi:hypothetical protein